MIKIERQCCSKYHAKRRRRHNYGTTFIPGPLTDGVWVLLLMTNLLWPYWKPLLHRVNTAWVIYYIYKSGKRKLSYEPFFLVSKDSARRTRLRTWIFEVVELFSITLLNIFSHKSTWDISCTPFSSRVCTWLRCTGWANSNMRRRRK